MAHRRAGTGQAEEELRQRLLQFTAILDNIPDIAWLKDRDSCFIAVNEAFGKACGHAPQDLVGKTDLDIWPRALAERYRADDRQVMQSRQRKHVEEQLRAADGRESWIETIKTPIFDANGEVIGTTGIARDITDRRQTQAALRDREEQYRLLFEQAIDGIGLADAETGEIIDCNPALLDLVGRERSEVVGRPQTILHPPEEDAGVFSTSFEAQRSLAKGQIAQAELLTKDGKRKAVEIKSNVFELKGRKVLQGIFRDFTERSRAEQEIQASRDMLHAVAQAQADFIEEGEPRGLFERLLTRLLNLTSSEYGFIGEVLRTGDGRPYLRTHAITNIAWNPETRRFYDENAPRGMEFSNLDTLFGAVMTTGQPVISNAPASDPRRGGLPEGHPPLRAFLGLPFVRGGEMVGMVGIANRPGGYDDGIVGYLQPLAATCATIIAAYRNESRRRRADEELRHSERLLSEAQSIAHLGSWKRDLIAGQLSWTVETYHIFGWPPAEPLDHAAFLRRVHPEDRERVAAAHDKALEGKADLDLEYRVSPAPQEVRWLHERTRMVRDGEGRLVALEGIVHDVTERKRAEAEKIEIERQLLHAQKLESLGVLAGGIAHDFNNLLMAILGNLDLALLRMAPGSSARSTISRAVAASYRAAELAQQMLAYSGRGRFVIQPVDLNGLVEENRHLFKAVLPKMVSLSQDLDPELPQVAADASQVQQVVMNLITNAAEAAGDGPGKIWISTGSRECDSATLERSRLKEEPLPGRFVFVSVRDTGCGMDQETLDRLFDPFFTTKLTGRGLGMSAVLGIVRAHGGAIFVDSAPGQGTTVTVLFPIAGPELGLARAAPAQPTDQKLVPPESQPETILVVDDEESVRAVCEEMLSQLGFRVLTAVDGQEAVEVFERHADAISCVLVDFSMPRMDGLHTIEALARIREDVPAILSSGYSDQDAMPRSSGRGPAGFLQKPYSLAGLERALGLLRGPRR